MTATTIEKDRQFASTLAHGIDLLSSYRVGESWLANKDFAERTGLSRPTVARLTHTLTVLGYLHRHPIEPRYRLGAAVLGISHPLLAGMRIRPIARPLMEALAREIGGAVSLGIRHRTHMVYVESARADDYFALPDIGAPLPMLATAMGRAWLAAAPPGERVAVLNQIRVTDNAQYEEHAAAAEAARQEYENEGFCSSRAQWRPGGHGFAVPIRGVVDANRFVLNCGAPAGKGSFAAVRRSVAQRLVTLAHSIEVMLGLR
jgi:DNA-binding IclR family transcriptional regulator